MNCSQFKILIVDDERSNLEILTRILKTGGTGGNLYGQDYVLSVAKSGEVALKIAQVNPPDLILLDIVMPGMNGFETLAALKASDATRHIPVIFITGLDSVYDEERGFALGAVDYITKPFHNSLVKARVKTHLRIVEQMRTIEQLGLIDTLTNIPNRREFERRMEEEWGRAVRQNTPISMLMIDIDNFKSFNDIYGHQQGDEALKTVAAVLTQTLIRPDDFAARWGGEEFVVILSETDYSEAFTIAEKIRGNVENAFVPNIMGEEPMRVTVSIGVAAEYPETEASMLDFAVKADKALYMAKEKGRNQVC